MDVGLPQELKRRDSPARRFFEDQFPCRAPIKRRVRRDALYVATIRTEGVVRWGTIGAAIDYRCKLCFLASHPRFSAGREGESQSVFGSGSEQGLLAGTGAYRLRERGILLQEDVGAFFSGLRNTANAIEGRTRRLTRKAEEDVCRRCFVLALFEEVARGGLRPDALLTRLPKHASVDDLLGLADDSSVEDLVQMAWRFYATQKPLLTGEGIVGPIIEGALDVGGADPDLIVDRCLIEIKTAVHPKNIAKPSWPWQLLAYALLDYDNAYELESVALYLARQGLLIRWSLDEYACLMADRHVSLTEARRDLQQALA